LARQALKELVERRLEEEMTEYLGLSRYEHGGDGADYRNGHYVRHLLTEPGNTRQIQSQQQLRAPYFSQRKICPPGNGM
jgi:transposase-like protein